MSKVDIIKRPVEQAGSNIKRRAWSAIIESAVILIIGILFVFWPDEMKKLLAYLVGAFCIIRGGVQIISYYMVEKGQNDFFNNNLLYGVVTVILGIAALCIGEKVADIFRIVIGIIIIYESLVRINAAVKLYSAKIKAWQIILVIALAMLVMGIFVTFYSGAIMQLFGWMMVLTGLVGIVGDVVFIKHVNIIIDKITGQAKAQEAKEKYADVEEAEVKED